ncbi:MAG: phosphoenolpyruvate--protein phosphotransferase [Gammaproteobacteria bacterium]
MSFELDGIGVSKGIAIGKAHVLQRHALEAVEYCIPTDKIADEVGRFRRAVDSAKRQLRGVRNQIPQDAPSDIAAFIDTHILMMDDAALSSAPVQLIEKERINAEWALQKQRDALVRVFDEMDDPYLRTRKDDVDHVVNRIQRLLMDADHHEGEIQENRFKGRIIIADDLTPADTVLMQHQGVAGFVTEYGGPLSHTAILARSLGIPAVVGVRNARRYLSDNERIAIDGRQGAVLADLTPEILKYYQGVQSEEKRYQKELKKLKWRNAVTRDGVAVKLMANIELPDDTQAVRSVGAEGVGLYRTEFLYMNRDTLPDEEEHYETYRAVIKTLRRTPITIRTLDLGSDKQVDSGRTNSPLPTNPALGLRAIRLCLRDQSLFRPQLRAILRVSAEGPVRIMIPMLSSTQELFQVLQIIEEIKRELRESNIKFDPDIPVGGMIEVPAAAISAHIFAKHLDFLSIGTNDLIQYTLAIDRIDDEVNYLYDPLHPSVLHLIANTISAGQRAGIPVAMCGEMAGDTRYTRLLLGLGLSEFSMHPSTLLEVKRLVNNTTVKSLLKITKRILRATHHSEICDLVDRLNEID